MRQRIGINALSAGARMFPIRNWTSGIAPGVMDSTVIARITLIIMRTFSKILLSFFLTLSLVGCAAEKTDIGQKESLTLVFPQLGAADCTVLIENGDHPHAIMIDTGETDDAEAILDVLQNYGIAQIDLLLISHYDKDHVGGAAEIIESIPVLRVIGSTSPKDSDEYLAYQSALEASGLTEEIEGDAETITLSENLSITIYPPQQEDYQEDQSNNSSTVVTVQYAQTSFLFNGDAMEQRVDEIQAQVSGVFDLIKLPHHGRDTQTAKILTEQFATENTALIVTSSKKEKEAEELQQYATGSVYLTRKGTITVVSDGQTISVAQNTD